ncbi:BTAD domain-containing putative transcriptional regulator [Actinacidiphila sp. DG2A-62]|uniref:AfsR/SARP family transcriptional regulator n=1 Tax=Actinacidiphila sp. DG2A-62 TaxID=3108821 RepID=UPI002DB844F6|nr:BTAD domain-containing putative transcriptional regulator [Actinacidiphila sp. DG2A-62]MEC3997822.1 BTAD domain-containing putative transcriptional regulator [Actinacidiphila sp. DG2A-62]
MSLNTALTSGEGAEGSERGTSGTGSAARFTVLGMLTVGDGTESVALQPSRPAALLAALLLHANSVVSAEFLQRVIWGARPPAQAKSALHSCVLRLRRLFGKYGIAPDAIQAVPGGYRLIADAATLDLVEFRGLLDRAYSSRDPENELELLRAALALWQPPLMANVHSELLHRDEVPRLREEWLRAIERVFELELARGRHREALAEIGAAARQYPLHERFTEQLMEALRRTGRRAEALAEYRRTKRRLAEQLGVDPGPQLQRLELDILRGDPAPPLPSAPSAPAAPALPSAPAAIPATAGPSRSPPGRCRRVRSPTRPASGRPTRALCAAVRGPGRSTPPLRRVVTATPPRSPVRRSAVRVRPPTPVRLRRVPTSVRPARERRRRATALPRPATGTPRGRRTARRRDSRPRPRGGADRRTAPVRRRRRPRTVRGPARRPATRPRRVR